MANSQSGSHRTRPRLHAAIRLTYLMHNIVNYFKSQINTRKQVAKELKICDRDKFKANAFEKIRRDLSIQSRNRTIVRTRCSWEQAQGQEVGLSRLLYDLDSHTQPGGDSIINIAAQDQLFLQHDFQQIASTKSIATLSHVLDVTTLLLDRFLGIRYASYRKISEGRCDYLKCEKLLANLEHLIRCLQQALVEALIHRALKLLNILLWDQYWQQNRQQSDEGWFAEWPNGQPPLSTTWPWNVKPSLVVLWGVCWMFYDVWKTFTKERVSENFWTGPLPSPNIDNLTHEPPLVGACLDLGLNSFSSSWLQVPSGERVVASDSQHALSQDQARASSTIPEFPPTFEDNTEEYKLFPNPSVTSSPSLDQPTTTSALGPSLPGNWIRNRDTGYLTSINDWQRFNNRQQPQYFITTPQKIEPQGGAEPYVPSLPRLATADLDMGAYELMPSLELPVQDMPALSGSHIELPTQKNSPCLARSTVSPICPAYPASTSSMGSPGSNQKGKGRLIDPARQEDGLLHCVHADCTNEPRAFSRKCEYTKHMDKHTRPYVCEERGCEKIQGFTYSGGLHRHQREVHHQHGGPKASCLCPYRDCKRSLAGRGFTRKENLTEHLRRVHRGAVDDEPAAPSQTGAGALSSTSQNLLGPRKRRRTVDGGSANADKDDDEESEEDARQLVKRLRMELQLKDERVKQLEMVIEKLKRLGEEQATVTAAV